MVWKQSDSAQIFCYIIKYTELLQNVSENKVQKPAANLIRNTFTLLILALQRSIRATLNFQTLKNCIIETPDKITTISSESNLSRQTRFREFGRESVLTFNFSDNYSSGRRRNLTYSCFRINETVNKTTLSILPE